MNNMNLKEIRKSLKMTQAEFAKGLEISRRAYVSIENGKALPRHKTIIKIEQMLDKYNYSIDELYLFNITNIKKENIKLNNKLEKLQKILKTIRFILEMNCEEFGSLLGVTKQTISNYETGKTKMPKIFYIAVRAVIDQLNDPMINDLLEVTIDHPEKYDDAENIAFTIDLFAKAIHGGANRKIISYSKMEYKRTDWLRECINKGE